MSLRKSICYKKPKPKSLPYLFFIHISNSPTCLLTLKKNIDPLNPFAKWFSGFFFHFCFHIISFLLFIFCNPLYEVVVVWLPIPTPYNPEWVVWESMCLVFFVERFLCDIFIGGNCIFCVKFPKNESFNCLFFVCHFLIGCERSMGWEMGKTSNYLMGLSLKWIYFIKPLPFLTWNASTLYSQAALISLLTCRHLVEVVVDKQKGKAAGTVLELSKFESNRLALTKFVLFAAN